MGLAAAAFLLLPRADAADNYRIDPAHTSLSFSVWHMGISNAKGYFEEFAGAIIMHNGLIKEPADK